MHNFKFLLLFLLDLSRGEQHILLDSTKESMLDWYKYPKGPQSPTPGWVEESFTNFDKGINWRSYVVCDVGYPNVNNWLWTPFIERGEANRIYIEIKFSLRNCDLFPELRFNAKKPFPYCSLNLMPPQGSLRLGNLRPINSLTGSLLMKEGSSTITRSSSIPRSDQWRSTRKVSISPSEIKELV